MCIIIVKKKGMQVASEVLESSSKINPHGLGVVWMDTFEITYHKSNEYRVLDTSRPYIAHFRYATMGAVNLANTHPFMCGSNKNEYLMMNGTIKGLGDQATCDSKVLAQNIGDVPRQEWKSRLAEHECRFVTINVRNKSYEIYNKHLWTQVDGVWYSKDNVLENIYVAVYGTLKKNQSNYHNYLSRSTSIGSGTTKDKYPLVIKGLPYLIENKGVGHNVDVDIFKVSGSTLAKLDSLEGHPNWYRRKKIPIMCNGKSIMCWIYFNIKENEHGQLLHKSYSAPIYVSRPYIAPKPIYPIYPSKRDFFFEEMTLEEQLDEVSSYDLNDEIPICVDCFHDLKHDGFANYHCGGCGGWFGEQDIVKFKL